MPNCSTVLAQLFAYSSPLYQRQTEARNACSSYTLLPLCQGTYNDRSHLLSELIWDFFGACFFYHWCSIAVGKEENPVTQHIEDLAH
jgi:hypothetical protein